MVNLIVNELVSQLAVLPFVDKITGVVKAASIQTSDGKVKTLPVAVNTDVGTCSQSTLLDYVPDSNKTSIIYFEDRGTTVTGADGLSIYFTSSFTLVCWFNYKKLSGGLVDSSLIAANILKYLPEAMGNISPLIGVFLNVNGQQPNDGAVFGKYTYIEEVTQFITYPFGYVALDLSADFKVRKDCITDIELCVGCC